MGKQHVRKSGWYSIIFGAATMFVQIFSVLMLYVSFSHGADILAILPTPSYSHQIAYTEIWKELSLRGHQVTLITTDPLNDPKLTNLTEIDMKWTYKYVADIGKLSQSTFTMWSIHEMGHNLILSITKAQLDHTEVQNLIHNKTHFDVVLVEFLYPEFLAFAEIYDCPKILICSMDVLAIDHYFVGNPVSPVLYPDMGANFHGPLNFRERVISTLYTCYTLYFYYYKSYYEKTEIVKKYFNISRTVHDLISDIDMVFVNTNPVLQPIRALGPSTITIGGNREELSSKNLPKDIADFLDSAVDGFVYFSLGSNVKSKDLNKDSLEAVTEALRELPYKILWKFEADELPNKPDNVKLVKWAPQQAVLSHPNIKVFVTQGGLQSFEEAFYREVPFVVIPFIVDQDQNARVMKSKGIAVVVDRLPSIKKVELKNAILEVINNPKYRNEVKKLKQLALDFPMTGLERAIWWTEYVIRNKGAKHLKNPAADIPFYKYYLIDVIGFLFIVIITIILILLFLVNKIVKLLKSIVNKSSKNKKMQ